MNTQHSGSNLSRVFLYRAKTQFENLGDLLINKLLLDLLKPKGTLLIDKRGVPENYLKQLGLNEPEQAQVIFQNLGPIRMILKSIRRKIKREGTTYFVCIPGHRYGQSTKSKIKSLIWYIFFLFFKSAYGNPIQIGASVGPFSRMEAFFEKLQSKYFYYYSVREAVSLDYAKKIGIQNVDYFPDLAWLMQDSGNALKAMPKFQNREILMSFREMNKPSNIKIIQVADLVVSWAKSNNFMITITHQVERDRKFCEMLYNRYPADSINYIDKQLNLDSMSRLYSQVSIVLSNRLHALIPAIILGSIAIPVIDTVENSKIYGIFSDVNLSDSVWNLSAPISNEVLEKIILRQSNLKVRYQKLIKEQREQIFQKMADLFPN